MSGKQTVADLIGEAFHATCMAMGSDDPWAAERDSELNGRLVAALGPSGGVNLGHRSVFLRGGKVMFGDRNDAFPEAEDIEVEG